MEPEIIEELLRKREFKELQQCLIEMEPRDISLCLGRLPPDEAGVTFRLLPKNVAVQVFDELDVDEQRRLLESLTDQGARVLLEAMPPDERSDLLEEVPAIVAKRLIQLLSPEHRQITLELLGYQEGTAGREMTPYFVDLHCNMTVAQALERIRRLAMNRETIYETYVTDNERHLLGTVSLKDLVLADPRTTLEQIIKSDPKTVSTSTDREEVVKVLRDYDLLAVPVVDSENRLVGIITWDDVADIAQEEATEDIYRFAAVSGAERDYFSVRLFRVVERRVPWLFLLILLNTITGLIIAGQGALLREFVILAAFIPLLIDAGGNAGTQSATVVIRGLATGEIDPKRGFYIVAREAGVGFLMGVILGVVAMGWAYIVGGNIRISIVVSLTLVCIATLATLTGGILPLISKVFKVDPALVSAPLLTTIMDLVGVILYFTIARLLLSV